MLKNIYDYKNLLMIYMFQYTSQLQFLETRSAIKFANNHVHHEITKHIELEHRFIQEKVFMFLLMQWKSITLRMLQMYSSKHFQRTI